jgi:hypothetical protein
MEPVRSFQTVSRRGYSPKFASRIVAPVNDLSMRGYRT